MRGSTDLGEPIARDRAIRKPEASTAAKFLRDLVRARSSHVLVGSYDYRLVLLSIVVAVVGERCDSSRRSKFAEDGVRVDEATCLDVFARILQGLMERGPVFLIGPVPGIERQKFDLGVCRQIGRLVYDESPARTRAFSVRRSQQHRRRSCNARTLERDPWIRRHAGAARSIDGARMSSAPAAVRSSIASDGMQQHCRSFGRHKQSVPAALVVDGVGVVLVAEIDTDRKALDANRRRPIQLELQQADAEILAHLRNAGSSRGRFALRSRRVGSWRRCADDGGPHWRHRRSNGCRE